MIRAAKKHDIVRVVDIHSESLPGDYLPRFGKQVLYVFYTTAWNDNPIIVYDDKGEILGFALVALCPINLKQIIVSYHKIILKKLFMQPSLWGQTLWLGLAPKDVTRYPELSFIAVEQGHRGRGVGSKLVDWICRFLEERGFNSLYVKTERGNERTNNFYKRNDFEIISVEKRFNKAFNLYVRGFM
jgi:ribosomal protein S18 acetylase RimI-like enzyme